MTARRKITDAQRRARLATRHRLLPGERTDDIAEITDSVVALHSTDPSTVYLSAMIRMKHPSVEAVSKALYEDRTIVRHHAMRRTLWVFTPQMARWAHAACTTVVAAREWKRLAKMAEDSGLTTDGAAWATVARAETLAVLTSMGSATTRQLGKEAPALTQKLHLAVGTANVAISGAHTRVLLNLGFDGAIVRGRPGGSWNNSEYPWSVAEAWIPGGVAGEDVGTGVAELARNYLARFGPVTTTDLQWWAGWTAGTTKRALAAIGAIEVDLDDGPGGDEGWILPADGDVNEPTEPWIGFLPALDSTTMGWKHRSWYLGALARFGGPVFDVNGNAGPTIWVDGRVVGGWAQRKSGEIVHRLLADVPARRVNAITAEAERIRGLIGDARVNVRFPAPIQKELIA